MLYQHHRTGFCSVLSFSLPLFLHLIFGKVFNVSPNAPYLESQTVRERRGRGYRMGVYISVIPADSCLTDTPRSLPAARIRAPSVCSQRGWEGGTEGMGEDPPPAGTHTGTGVDRVNHLKFLQHERECSRLFPFTSVWKPGPVFKCLESGPSYSIFSKLEYIVQ
jgi:hypothetical protein